MRFVVTALFAWMLIRATFANTVAWRHSHVLLGAPSFTRPANAPLARNA